MVWGIFLKNILRTAFLYTGTLIGAGFASGSEITVYFMKNIRCLIVLFFISSAVFGIYGKLVMDTAIKSRVYNYEDFIKNAVGKKCASIINFITGLFFMVLFSAMISAFGTIFYNIFGINKNIGGCIFLFICIPVIFGKTEGLVKANCILVPILIAGILFCSVYVCVEKNISIGTYSCIPRIVDVWYGMKFIFYNMVSCVPILIQHSKEGGEKSSYGCIISALILFLIGLSMSFAIDLCSAQKNVMPMIFITKNISKVMYIIYIVSFLASVYTTAAGNGYCATEWFMGKEKNKFLFILFIFLAYIMSFLNFYIFVEKLYSIFSLIGMVELLAVIFYRVRVEIKG